MTPLKRLTAILCECESVKKDVMELRVGTKIMEDGNVATITRLTSLPVDDGCSEEIYGERIFDNYSKHTNNTSAEVAFYNKYKVQSEVGFLDWLGDDKENKTLGNPIQDHHLRMYCEERGIHICILGNGYICKMLSDSSIINILIKLKPKPLYQQSDEILEQIIEFLEANK